MHFLFCSFNIFERKDLSCSWRSFVKKMVSFKKKDNEEIDRLFLETFPLMKMSLLRLMRAEFLLHLCINY